MCERRSVGASDVLEKMGDDGCGEGAVVLLLNVGSTVRGRGVPAGVCRSVEGFWCGVEEAFG